ncbi:MAG TPA: hypothetical protein VF530_21580 [Planctomycetota bacterium]
MRAGALLLVSWMAACVAPRERQVLHQDTRDVTDPDAGYRSAFYGKNGIALGVRGLGTRMGGDFDGDTTLVGPDTIFLSDVDDALGYELALGYRNEGTGWELAYARTYHEGDFAGFPGDVDYRAFTFRGLHYWRANSEWQPFGLVGFVLPLADIEDGSSLGPETGTAQLRGGFGLELGGGLACWLTPRLVLDLRTTFVYQEFSRAEGVADDEDEIDDGVSAPSLGLGLGLTWVLGGSR